ncbi:hypothetical protein [Photobacterium arenosum]|uniref:hypothetical protein n=1 Tax=Photobacterium arenosum TaxID=2774143 RepID=UPI00288AE069|nr:hypothetical protein [Photobacterium arenosum]
MISKETWQKIEEELAQIWVQIEFEYQGYRLSVLRERHGEGKLVLTVYIDDVIKASWATENEERLAIIPDVWRVRSKAYYSPAKVKKIEKDFGKRQAKKYFPNLHERYTWHEPYFPKASILVRQFKKLKGLKLMEKRPEIASREVVNE